MLESRVIYQHSTSTLLVDPSRTLAWNLFMNGFSAGIPLCAGLGKCGKCALVFHDNAPIPSEKDYDYFSRADLDIGWRLGCSHYPQSGQTYEIPEAESFSEFFWSSKTRPEGLGIDIGTTFIKWGVKHECGQVSSGQAMNPQMGAGPDIMSRLSFACENSQNFRFIQRLVTEKTVSILSQAGIKTGHVCITGNPAMIYLLLGRDVSGLAVSPYVLEYSGGKFETVGSNGFAAFIPKLWSPFAGGDLSAGLDWILTEENPAYPFLLADFGTNGELVLGLSPHKYLVTSVALGPALEGIGLRFGSPFRQGTAAGFILNSQGIEAEGRWDTGRVSGSGYISLVGHLIRLKLLTVAGHFAPGKTPVAKRIQQNIRDGRMYLGKSFYIDGRDIEEILKVKAAFSVAFCFLCTRAGISPDELRTIYIAGALGEHANIKDLETLGFFPPGSSNKCCVVGNSALKGAVMLAGDESRQKQNILRARLVEPLNLGIDMDRFSKMFALHMQFNFPRHTAGFSA